MDSSPIVIACQGLLKIMRYNKIMKFFTGLLLIVVIAIGSFWYYLTSSYPTLPPLVSGQYVIESVIYPHAKLEKHVLGFLPYWRLDDLQHIRPSHLSEINYFSLTANADGSIAKVVDGQTDPGWRSWQSDTVKNFLTRAQIAGADISITVAALDNEDIESILDSPTAQTTLITQTIDEVKDRKLQGVNIDFEYFGETDAGYRQAFTAFSKKLRAAIDKEVPGTELSLSIMPLAAREDDLFEFKQLAPVYDRFIGMSYEYYGSTSDISGPVAPMKGFKEGKYFFDVETTYEDYLKVLPKEKIVMGVPYYGWERSVVEAKTENSLTYAAENENNYAAVISYARYRESKDIKKNQCKWDDLAQETWCWFKDPKTGADRQVWLADNRSIETRFEYAKKQDFGGVALWTLGYDKQYLDLWELILNKFGHQ
jgi:spore germination protein YaaH